MRFLPLIPVLIIVFALSILLRSYGAMVFALPLLLVVYLARRRWPSLRGADPGDRRALFELDLDRHSEQDDDGAVHRQESGD